MKCSLFATLCIALPVFGFALGCSKDDKSSSGPSGETAGGAAGSAAESTGGRATTGGTAGASSTEATGGRPTTGGTAGAPATGVTGGHATAGGMAGAPTESTGGRGATGGSEVAGGAAGEPSSGGTEVAGGTAGAGLEVVGGAAGTPGGGTSGAGVAGAPTAGAGPVGGEGGAAGAGTGLDCTWSTVYPFDAEYATGSVDDDGVKTSGNINVYTSDAHGFLKFDLSSLDADATVLAATLTLTLESTDADGSQSGSPIYPLTLDPTTADGTALYGDCVAGDRLWEGQWDLDGGSEMEHELNGAGVAFVQSQIATGWAGLGMADRGWWFEFYGYNDQSRRPRLDVCIAN